MKKTKEQAEETRKAILQSALDLFYEKGYSKTTFELISARINLTKGAVYWYFKNKPDLLVAIINMYLEQKMLYLSQKVPALEHIEDIKTYFTAMADFLLSNPNAYKVAFFLSLQMEWSESNITRVLEGVSKNAKNSFEYVKKSLEIMQKKGEIRSNIKADVLSSIIFNLWTGNVEACLSKRNKTNLKDMVQQSFDLLFNGLILKKE